MAEAPTWGFPGLGPETRWLLGHGLRTRIDGPVAVLDDAAWSRLRDQALSHRLEGHLIAAVLDGSLPTSPRQRAEAARVELASTERRTRYDDVCRPVLAALADAGIEVRLLKGSSLPWADYPDPQLRPTGDLDLLVRGSDLVQASRTLLDHGATEVNPEPTVGFARRVFKGLTLKMPSGLEVDLHRILSWGPFGVRVPETDLWAPGRTFDRLGTPAVTLDVERTLIHVSAHLLLLGAIRAGEVRDVAQVASTTGLDTDRAVTIAHRWGHEAVLATALCMAERELDLVTEDLPLFRWARELHVGRRDRLWLRVDRPVAPVRGIEPVGVFVELRGIRPRLTMLRATVAPRPGTDPGLLERLGRLRRSTGSPEAAPRTPSQATHDSPDKL